MSQPAPAAAAPRLASLDAFRGLTMASMVLVNNPGTWSAVYAPLRHAEWHGWTFTDTVFPFFLWMVGVAMTLSFARRVERGDDRGRLLRHVVQRSAILFGIGLLMALIPRFAFATVRIPGVLQRIAVCYLVAAAIFLWTPRVRAQIAWCAGLLLGYTALMTLVPVPGCGAASFEKDCNFARWVDGMALSGHMWASTKVWDPEGIVSTIPAIATTLFGVLTGHLLRLKQTAETRAAWIFTLGALLMFAGLLWDLAMPINKNLWTASYAVFMAGLAATVFAVCYWLIDQQGWRKPARPFEILGMNAIAVFVISGMLAKTLGLLGWQAPLFRGVFLPLASPVNASLLYAVANVALMWLIAYGMYRRGWFVRF